MDEKSTEILNKINCINENERVLSYYKGTLKMASNYTESFNKVFDKNFFANLDNISFYIIDKVNFINQYILLNMMLPDYLYKIIENLLCLLLKIQQMLSEKILYIIYELEKENPYYNNIFNYKILLFDNIELYKNDINDYVLKLKFNKE